MCVGDYLKNYKCNMNFSYTELSKKSGISTPTLRGIIKKEIRPNIKTCYKIAKLTGCQLKDIVSINQ